MMNCDKQLNPAKYQIFIKNINLTLILSWLWCMFELTLILGATVEYFSGKVLFFLQLYSILRLFSSGLLTVGFSLIAKKKKELENGSWISLRNIGKDYLAIITSFAFVVCFMWPIFDSNQVRGYTAISLAILIVVLALSATAYVSITKDQ